MKSALPRGRDGVKTKSHFFFGSLVGHLAVRKADPVPAQAGTMFMKKCALHRTQLRSLSIFIGSYDCMLRRSLNSSQLERGQGSPPDREMRHEAANNADWYFIARVCKPSLLQSQLPSPTLHHPPRRESSYVRVR